MIKNNRVAATVLSVAVLGLNGTFSLPAQAADFNYRVVATQHLDGDVKWDYLTMDNEHRRLFITRGDHVDVYDLAKKVVVGHIPNTNGVHGVALAPQLDRGFASNGKDNGSVALTNVNQTYYWDLIRSQTERICPAKV
jgi:hypothetical protein